MNELISVIVPIYNIEAYLDKCIISIINQTYKNLEIILIDDGSTDSSKDICDKYKNKDSRIVVVHKKNGGLSSARNAGLDIASGSLISFVDGDDYIEPKMIEELKKNMDKWNSDISVCNYFNVMNNEKNVYKFNKKNFVLTDKEKFDYLENEYRVLSIYAWNKLYKRYLFDNIRYPKNKIFEDAFIICDLFDQASKVSYIMKPLYNYVLRSNSLVHTFTIHHFDKIDGYNKRVKFFKKKKYYDLVLKEQNRKALILAVNLSKLKYYKIDNKEIKNKYYQELLKTIKQIKWKDASRRTKIIKIFKSTYIYFRFVGYKVCYIFKG